MNYFEKRKQRDENYFFLNSRHRNNHFYSWRRTSKKNLSNICCRAGTGLKPKLVSPGSIQHYTSQKPYLFHSTRAFLKVRLGSITKIELNLSHNSSPNCKFQKHFRLKAKFSGAQTQSKPDSKSPSPKYLSPFQLLLF